ncbi:MAG: glycyl-radical enzyme activating protein [Spirochaetaceae bacterium]|jgi:pyruvate formate lyase activating enzyme|nr:glycyl-radical enzyme activating protein [Spirochaetaceae bacterium]
MTGKLFDIRRFSVHDGQGIRSAVFLKGCPLRCRWCQNPEGLDFESRPLWFESRCIRCGACAETAERVGAEYLLTWENEKLRINSSDELWDTVMDVCPARALAWDSYAVSAEETVAELKKDKVFFQRGGGITLSGGEPLAQPEFALELLSACRREGLHTAIETSFFAPPEIVDAAVSLCDAIIGDCKIFDDTRHIEAVGQSNARILANIERLLSGSRSADVLIRTPLIPGFTADEKNIRDISRFLRSVKKDAAYELLNYNPLAAGKYALTGKTYCFKENPKPFTAEELLRFKAAAM